MTPEPDELVRVGADGVARCWWCGDDLEYVRYHDEEWGRPVDVDRRLFEKLCLEGFQSGLSWLTILRKRDAFRRAFADFDPDAVAGFDATDVARLLGDASIVRHRGKIEAAIDNAGCALRLQAEFGSLVAYFRRYDERLDDEGRPRPFGGVVARTATSERLAADLKARGFRFVGPTTAYAFMQAVGLVDDHAPGCAHRSTVPTRW